MSERSPLIHPGGQESPGYGSGSRHAPEPSQQDDETTIISKELSFPRLAMILSTAWLGVFLGAADTTVIATLSAQISSEFNSLSLLSWLATAYLIANSISQPISGRLTDIFGRGPGLAFCNVAFAIGNLICGVATSQRVMVLGRVIAGIGGGGLMSIPVFLGSDLVPLRRRGLVGGIANLWYGSGAMVGAVFGGLLNDYTIWGWRMAFLIQVIPSLLSAVIVYVLIKVPPKQSEKSYIKRIDFGGVFLVSTFLASLVLCLSSGGNIVPWINPLPVMAISLSVFLFATFIYWELRASQPIIPVRLLLNRTVLASCLASVFCSAIAFTSIFYIPLYLQARGDSATNAGLKILPASLGTCLGGLIPGYLMKRSGKYVGLVIGSIVVLIFGTGLFALQDDNTPTWMTCLAFFVVGLGYNAVFTITQIACIAAVGHTQQAVVTSSTYLARSLGGTVGITLASVLYQSSLDMSLWALFGDKPNAADKIQKIKDDLTEIYCLPKAWYEGVLESLMQAFGRVWLMMLAWAVLALVCISPIKQHKLFTTLDRE
ncbi:major facilitator superfamily domain-containing protein [Fusarium redolens]|uniref:Major facilitator superfamily domain-containing protein n=1 Tax=Fusarium redolens TaxID=48865 RepID=A0A9P9H9L3_FUSRE|nr:major facilitator superfamily domain-containing protein [Fusarium redolens]KAH7253684.1 major facilitator superfamily domain-containing protein [Fusarium redolens]